MYADGNNVFNDASVSILLEKHPILLEGWNNRGGWNTIKSIMSISEPKNIESYIDDFNKYQYLKFLHSKGFCIDLDKMDKMSAKQTMAYYEYLIANDEINVDKLITKRMDMKYAKKAIEMHRDGEAIKILLEN